MKRKEDTHSGRWRGQWRRGSGVSSDRIEWGKKRQEEKWRI